MQPIERYGLIALIFLVITIAAACLWDPDEEAPADGAAVAQAPAGGAEAPQGEPRPRDFVGMRTPPRAGQSLSERQRERMLALQQEEAAAAPQGDELSAREALLARREAALAAREESLVTGEEPPRTHLGLRTDELLASAADKAGGVMDLMRSEPEAEPAAEPEPRQPAAPVTKRTYVVQKGDTLSEIASKELGTWKRWKEIVDANPGLDADNMRVGARIALPGAASGAGASATAARETASTAPPSKSKPKAKEASATYVVQSNDSLWKIADKALGDGERWREIAALNPKIEPDQLEVGDRLVLPAGGSKQVAASDERVAKAEPAAKRGKVR